MLELACPPHKSREEWLAMDDFREYLLTTTRGEIPLYYLDGPLTGKILRTGSGGQSAELQETSGCWP
jgi:hypothetical protein